MAEPDGQTGRIQMVTIDENNDGQRLDNFLIAQLKGVPRSWVYRVLRRGDPHLPTRLRHRRPLHQRVLAR